MTDDIPAEIRNSIENELAASREEVRTFVESLRSDRQKGRDDAGTMVGFLRFGVNRGSQDLTARLSFQLFAAIQLLATAQETIEELRNKLMQLESQLHD